MGLGVYYFLCDDGPAGTFEQSTDHFLVNIQGYIGLAVLVLDWEPTVHADPLLADVGYAKRWLDRVYSKTGVRPMNYMSQSTTYLADWTSMAKDHGLIVAQYPSGAVQGWGLIAAPPNVAYWAGITMWQYSQSGQLPGYGGQLDLNVFFGDRAAWNQVAAKKG